MKSSGFEEINSPDFLQRLLSDGKTMNSAFKRLVLVMHNPLLYYIRRYIQPIEEAQEVLQEVLLAIHKGVHKFQGKSKLTTWIYSMTHHKVCDKISDRSWQHEEYTEFKDNAAGLRPTKEQVSKTSEWDASPDRVLSIKQVQGKLPQIVEGLSANLKDVYILRDVEGMSGADTAEILKISEEAVRVRLHRARNFIVDSMKKMEQESVKSDSPFEVKN